MLSETVCTVTSPSNQELSSSTETSNAAIKLFEDKGFKIRVIMRLGDPWFVAKDVCDNLTISNARQACQTLDDDEKDKCKVYTLGGDQDMMVISESGLYTLIMRSNKPEAKPFRTHNHTPKTKENGLGYCVRVQ